MGYTQRRDLKSLLCDGNHDYEITLTPKGKQHLLSPSKLKFWGCDL
jgi:hypothetical protein